MSYTLTLPPCCTALPSACAHSICPQPTCGLRVLHASTLHCSESSFSLYPSQLFSSFNCYCISCDTLHPLISLSNYFQSISFASRTIPRQDVRLHTPRYASASALALHHDITPTAPIACLFHHHFKLTHQFTQNHSTDQSIIIIMKKDSLLHSVSYNSRM